MHAAAGDPVEHQHLQLISASASAMCFMTANALPICITHAHICTFVTHPSLHTQACQYLMADGGNAMCAMTEHPLCNIHNSRPHLHLSHTLFVTYPPILGYIPRSVLTSWQMEAMWNLLRLMVS